MRIRVREFLVHGLPLLIMYAESDDLVEIIAVVHTSRDPSSKPRR